ncbi:hypothetical protein STZ1_60012 [Bacillus subtilis]
MFLFYQHAAITIARKKTLMKIIQIPHHMKKWSIPDQLMFQRDYRNLKIRNIK